MILFNNPDLEFISPIVNDFKTLIALDNREITTTKFKILHLTQKTTRNFKLEFNYPLGKFNALSVKF